MGFSSIDDWINKVTTLGQFCRVDWNKQTLAATAYALGNWYDMDFGLGNPPPQGVLGEYVWNGGPTGSAWGWTLNSPWTYSAGFAHASDGTGEATQTPTLTPVVGKTYRVVYTCTRTAGTIRMRFGGTLTTARSSASTWTEDIVAVDATGIALVPSNDYRGTVTLVSIAEPLGFTPLKDNITPGALYHGGNVSPATKHVLNTGVFSAIATANPGVWMLVDKLAVYPYINNTINTLQTLLNLTLVVNGTFTGSATGWTLGAGWAYGTDNVTRSASAVTTMYPSTTIPITAGMAYRVTYTISGFTGTSVTVSLGGVNGTARAADGTYSEVIVTTTAGNLIFTPTANAAFTLDTVIVTCALPRYSDGAGVRAYLTPAMAVGANAHNFTVTYRNPSYTEKTLPVTVAGTATIAIGRINHGGVNANNYGPFLPLAAGDTGIFDVKDVQQSAASATGTNTCLVLCKPLLTIPVTTASVCSERDLMNQLPSLPRVYDGAFLTWLFFPGGNTVVSTNIYGYLDFCWG